MEKGISTLLASLLLFGTLGYITLNTVEIKKYPLPWTYAHRLTELELLEATNNIRKEHLKRYCQNHRKMEASINDTYARWLKMRHYQKPRIFFSDSAKLLFCDTPKCGTTQWRNLMLILDGHLEGYEAPATDYFDLAWKHSFLWLQFNPLKTDGKANITGMMQNYYKIMTTREPLERLVSAYRDKLESNKNNTYYVTVSKRIHKTMNRKSKTPALATFEEFIDYILSRRHPSLLDPHWKPYSALCDPCNIDYDYIARMETVYDDATYITSKIGVARDRIYNRTGMEHLQQKRIKLYHEYFGNLSLSKRTAIFNYYKTQYDMFGYQYPTFINMSAVR